MKKFKLALIFGISSSLVMSVSWWLTPLIWPPVEGEIYDFTQGEFIGYTAMILSLTAVFIGVKRYRDQELGGFISFKQAFVSGLYIVLVASVFYVISWLIYMPLFMPDFPEQYAACQVLKMEEAGLPQVEIEAKRAEMDDWVVMYDNIWVKIGMTFVEVFPIGLIVALISAFILKRKLVSA